MRTLHDEKMMILTHSNDDDDVGTTVCRCVLLRKSLAVILSLSIKKPTYIQRKTA